MAIRVYKPTSPARRFMSVLSYEGLTKKAPEKSLTTDLRHKAGRNNTGKITVRHQGGGERRKYRIIDFQPQQGQHPGEGHRDRVRSEPHLLHRPAGITPTARKRYILAPLDLKVGDTVVSGAEADIKPGNCLPIANIPVGTLIHNIEFKPGHGGQMVRSAGTAAQLMAKEGVYAQVRLPSGEVRKVLTTCRATIGQVGNPDHENVRVGKAGRTRHMGIRPTVRGVVMNPCDHPHGGGEGRSPVGMPAPMSPWGKPTQGVKTRKHRKYSDKLIVKRAGK